MAKLSVFVLGALLAVFGISFTNAKNLGDDQNLFNKCIKSGGLCYDSSECCNNLKCDESPDSERRCHYVPPKDELNEKIKDLHLKKNLRSSNLRAKTIEDDDTSSNECSKTGDACTQDDQCCGDAKCHTGLQVLSGICHLVPTPQQLTEAKENLKPVPKGTEGEKQSSEDCDGIRCRAKNWLLSLVSNTLSRVKSLFPSYATKAVVITSAVPPNVAENEKERSGPLKRSHDVEVEDDSSECVKIGLKCGGIARCCKNLTCREERLVNGVVKRCAYVPSIQELQEKIKDLKHTTERSVESEEDSSEVGGSDKANKGLKSGKSSVKRIGDVAEDNTDDDDEVDSELNKEPVKSSKRKHVNAGKVKNERASKLDDEDEEEQPKRKSGKSNPESEESEETLV